MGVLCTLYYGSPMNLVFLKNIDLNHLGIQIALVCAALVLLWLLIKSLKIFWKLLFVIGILLALSFALHAVRQWIFSFF